MSMSFKKVFWHFVEKYLTFYRHSAIIVKQCVGTHGRICRNGGIGRRPGLKIPWDFISYRFDPGFRHHNIAEWSSLAARRAHNPKVMRFKSHLRNQRNSITHSGDRVLSFLVAVAALCFMTLEVMSPRSQSDQRASNLRTSKNDWISFLGRETPQSKERSEP